MTLFFLFYFLIDADILSCLVLQHFTVPSSSNGHVLSLRYKGGHWCVCSPSLCIFPLLCLQFVRFSSHRVSVVHVPGHSSTLSSLFLSLPSSYHLDVRLNFILLMPLHLEPAGLSATSVYFLINCCHHTFTSCLLRHTCVFTPHPPHSPSPTLFHPRRMAFFLSEAQWCQCVSAAEEGENERWCVCLFSKFFSELRPIMAHAFTVQGARRRQFMHRSQAGKATTGPGCSPKIKLLEPRRRE